MKTERDKELEAWAARRLDERAASLDGATRSRLRQAREMALAQRLGWRRWFTGSPAAVAGATAMAAVAMLAVSLWTRMPEEVLPTLPGATDLEIMASGVELDLYDDLEFYLWLDSEEQPG